MSWNALQNGEDLDDNLASHPSLFGTKFPRPEEWIFEEASGSLSPHLRRRQQSSAFFCLSSFFLLSQMGMLISLNPVLISDIIQATSLMAVNPTPTPIYVSSINKLSSNVWLAILLHRLFCQLIDVV